MAEMAMILAGGEGPTLSVLTAKRSESAVPFAGKYRIIDFALSNCVNSGIFDVAILTQYQPRSLNEHIGVGRPWDLDRTAGGVRLLQPYQSTKGERGAWQDGTADALRFNLNILRPNVDDVLILAGDHVYTMDYRPMLRAHRERNADVTLAVCSVPEIETHRFGMVTTDTEGRALDFKEKPRRSSSTLASMGIYVFKRQVLTEWLTESDGGRMGQNHNLARDLIPRHLKTSQIYAYHFKGYWADVGTIQAYYDANMALLAEDPALDLYDPDWVIHTRSEERAAAQIGPHARVAGSLLCDGCRVDGTVIRSIISPGVYIAQDAVVRDSIIMTDTLVEPGAEVDRAIVDKRVVVGAGAQLGWGDQNTPNTARPDLLNTGLTLVGKGAVIPAHMRVGRNAIIHPRATAEAYPAGETPAGATVGEKP